MPISVRPTAATPAVGSQHPSSVPANDMSSIVHSPASLRPRRLRPGALQWTVVSVTGLRSLPGLAVLGAALLAVGSHSIATAETAILAPSLQNSSAIQYAEFTTEAARRFAIPERWIRAVMRAESGGNPHAVSPRGALGLMQIMPGTWGELRARYELGINPFDPRDSILAGAAYLREMLDRFGSDGFLAAYNAGPKRYEEHLAAGRPLPDATKDYVARLAPLMGIEQRERGISIDRHVVNWRQAPAFVQQSDSSSSNALLASPARLLTSSRDILNGGALALAPRATGLFVRIHPGAPHDVGS